MGNVVIFTVAFCLMKVHLHKNMLLLSVKIMTKLKVKLITPLRFELTLILRFGEHFSRL